MIFGVFRRLSCRDDLQPVAIRVLDEVNAHGGVLVADDAHLAVQLVGGLKILRPEGQVEFAFAQIVGLGVVLEPGELQLEIRLLVAYEDDGEAVASPGYNAGSSDLWRRAAVRPGTLPPVDRCGARTEGIRRGEVKR